MTGHEQAIFKITLLARDLENQAKRTKDKELELLAATLMGYLASAQMEALEEFILWISFFLKSKAEGKNPMLQKLLTIEPCQLN